MTDERTNKDIRDLEELSDPELYVYILKNELGKVKVGITTNILKRVQSLGGSNGQGINITRCYCSPATYLYSLERIMHDKMSKYNIPNTEWFYYKEDPSGDRLFNNAVKVLNKLMNSEQYERSNELRKNMSKRRN